MKNYIFIALLTLIFNTCFSQDPWEITYGNVNYSGQSDVSFISPNVGYAVGYTNSVVWLLKTTNKGLNWYLVRSEYADYYWCKNSSISFRSETVGFISYGDRIVKYNNGVIDTVLIFPTKSSWHRIRFANDSIGYAVFNRVHDGITNQTNVSIYKTTSGGNSWFLTSASNIQTQSGLDKYSQLRDIDISNSDANTVHAVGFYVNGSLGTSLHVYTSDGFNSRTVGGDASSGSKFGHVSISQNNEVRILGNRGLKAYNIGGTTYAQRYDFGNQTNVPEFGMDFINNSVGYVCLQTGKIMKTTNGGNNWTLEVDCGASTNINESSTLVCFGDMVFYADATNKNVFTRTLSTNFNTFFDNQSTPSSIFFDGIQYASPSTQYLRGGNSIISTPLSSIIDPNQNTEKIFYKWSDGNMYHTRTNSPYYFDQTGSTIANYYKTKQLSTTPAGISNVDQVKALKDSLGRIHQIHQSLEGGIFYTKSYNNGSSYRREEVVNYSSSAASGNKNPALYETKWAGGIASGYPGEKNVGACWERFNASTNQTEIKVAVRDFEVTSDTNFIWRNWQSSSQSDVFCSFNTTSSYNSNPKIFAIVLNPGSYLGNPSMYFFIIPHLRPFQGGNKLVISCRRGPTFARDFVLDSGDISDLAVVDSVRTDEFSNALRIHFAYRKGNQILYRKEKFMHQFSFQGNDMIDKYYLEGPKDVTTGDGGFASRLNPDISIMDSVPVITYSANYNAWRLVEFENDQTETIPVYRYPIVKVQRISANTWSNYVIYNSSNGQYNPDIEGSKTTFSYLLNYSLGNNQFKKVVSVHQHPGYICQPNIYNGTDSRLVNNSYAGLYGNNLSLLTLSPQSDLYKLDKQDFIITNITSADSYDIDNLDGVVNLDTIKYSFRLGPIYIQDGLGGLEGGTFGGGSGQEDPILTNIEFNENLKSYPFLLNEDQALLIGASGTYLKDNGYYSISEIPYTVNLYNYSTGQLHRVLFQDTIHAEDSIETEYLRGFFITNIPNDEDSFYVRLEPDHVFDYADYYINPIYDDPFGPVGPDNLPGNTMAVIFENEKIQNEISALPTDFKLSQNYPNPFNPTTKITYSLPEDGMTKITVYDIAGKEIAVLVNETRQAGTYNIVFNGINFASGVYFYRIQSNDFIQTKQMVLIK